MTFNYNFITIFVCIGRGVDQWMSHFHYHLVGPKV